MLPTGTNMKRPVLGQFCQTAITRLRLLFLFCFVCNIGFAQDNTISDENTAPYYQKQDITKEDLKQYTNMEYNEIMNLFNRYDEWRKYLPSYSLRLNQNLDSINKKINSVIPFKYIGNSPNKRLIGFVDEGNDINIYDGIGKHLMKLGSVDKKSWSINWGTHSVLQQEHSSYITSSVRELKNRNWL